MTNEGSSPPVSLWRRVLAALHLLQVRSRFIVVFVLMFLIVGKWDTISYYWETWVGRYWLTSLEQGVSSSTEYFCPMCPGVHSAWPAQCPICNMPLVRRTKGDMGILPDGALVRMQISPYRLQLGGIATTRVEYRELKRADGVPWAEIEPYSTQPRAAPPLAKKEPRTVHVCPNHPQHVSPAAGVCPLDAAVLIPCELAEHERLRWQCPLHPAHISAQPGDTCPQCAGLPLPAAVVPYAPERAVLAIPQSAVLESSGLQVVFQQSSPGVFDATPVELGPASEGYYPVIAGMRRGSEVVSQGAFLLDAETRLDPDLAAAYFGADVRGRDSGGSSSGPARSKSSPAEIARLLEKLTLTDRQRALALRQRVCPVTNLPLGSMGAPVSVQGAGQEVQLCCAGCRGKFETQHAAAQDAGKDP